MRFAADAIVSHPITRVYPVYRDHFDLVAVDVENIERVTVPSCEAVAGGVVVTHVWHGRGFIPEVARRWLAPQMLTWDGWVTWCDAEHRCDWRIATRYFAECIRCTGEVRFAAGDGDCTRVTMSGELCVTLDTLRAVPRLVRRIVARRSERLLLGMVPRNLAGVARRVDAYLAAQSPRHRG